MTRVAISHGPRFADPTGMGNDAHARRRYPRSCQTA